MKGFMRQPLIFEEYITIKLIHSLVGVNIPTIRIPDEFVRYKNGDLYPVGMQAH